MTDERELLDLERQFWLGDADLYARRLTADALMVFPQVGVLGKPETVAAISAAARWTDVRLEEFRIVEISTRVVLVTYRAFARRDGQDEEYRTLASSLYTLHEGHQWLLAFHQQSPEA